MTPDKKDEHIEGEKWMDITDHFVERSEIIVDTRSLVGNALENATPTKEDVMRNIISRHPGQRAHYGEMLLAMDPTDAELQTAISKIPDMKEQFVSVLLDREEGKRGQEYKWALMESMTEWGPLITTDTGRRVLKRLAQEDPTPDDINNMLQGMPNLKRTALQRLSGGNITKTLDAIAEALRD